MTDANLERVKELAYRYFGGAVGIEGFPELAPDEVGEIDDYVWSKFSEDEYAVMSAYSRIENDYARGLRCRVCGMTEAQARAANYDCIREC